MKFFTLPALLATALFSAVVVIPFLPAAKTHSDLFFLEARLNADQAGRIQLYYDNGAGFSESASSHLRLAAGTTPAVYRLDLPPGDYRALRFDPTDRDGTVTIESLNIVAATGRVIRPIAFSELRPANDIAALNEHDGRLEVAMRPGAYDAQLRIDFSPPLGVHLSAGEIVRDFLARAAGVFAAFALLLFALERAPAFRARAAGFAQRLAARPGRAITLVAALAVIASAYPVVFLGQSYVSPNFGTTLLYGGFPTLPGYTDGDVHDSRGSDVGAVMWAHLPYSIVEHRALAGGELPLWDRYNSTGTPLLAQGQSMFGDPLNFLVILCHGAPWAWDLRFLAAKWLFAVALGLLVLAVARHLPAALIVTFAAPFVGFFVFRINHPAIFSLSYAPWVLYCWVRIAEVGPPGRTATRRPIALWIAVLVAANFALMNSGTVKEAYMLLLAMNFSGACVLLAVEAPWRTRLAKFAALAWAGVLFALLTAPVWLTFLNTLRNAYTGYNAPSAAQLQPSLLLGAFDELFYRPLSPTEFVRDPSVNFVIALGLVYFLATLRHAFAERAVMALAASALVPLAIVFGLVPPQWIMRVPFLGNVAHVDNCFLCALIVLWSVLAGVGFARAAARLGTREGRGDLAIAALLLAAVVVAWIGFQQAGFHALLAPSAANGVLIRPFVWGALGALLAASGALAWATRRALARRALTPALAIGIATCAAVMLWRQALHSSSLGFEDYTVRPTARQNYYGASPALDFLRAAQKREPMRGFGLHGNFFAGWTAVYGLETIYGADALVNPWLRDLIDAAGVERIFDWLLRIEPANVAAARPFFDALNVRYYLDQDSDQRTLGRSLTLVQQADLDIYESPTVWPRAFFTDRLELYDQPADFAQKIRTGDGRPFAALQRPDLAMQPALTMIPRALAERTVVPAAHYQLTENTTSFDIHATAPGVVVLIETLWPGDFRADIDGHKVPVLRLNHAFKGVFVDSPGDYRVTFRYVPKNFPRNLMLSGLGAVLLVGSLAIAMRRPRAA